MPTVVPSEEMKRQKGESQADGRIVSRESDAHLSDLDKSGVNKQ